MIQLIPCNYHIIVLVISRFKTVLSTRSLVWATTSCRAQHSSDLQTGTNLVYVPLYIYPT